MSPKSSYILIQNTFASIIYCQKPIFLRLLVQNCRFDHQQIGFEHGVHYLNNSKISLKRYNYSTLRSTLP